MNDEERSEKLDWAFSQIRKFREKAKTDNDVELYKKLSWLYAGADSENSSEHNYKIWSYFEELVQSNDAKFSDTDIEIFKKVAWVYRVLNNQWNNLPEYYESFFDRFRRPGPYKSYEDLPDSIKKYIQAIEKKGFSLDPSDRQSMFRGLTAIEALNSGFYADFREFLISWGDARIMGTYPLPDEI